MKSEAIGNALTGSQRENTIFLMLILQETFQKYLVTFTLQLTWDRVLSAWISWPE